MQGTEQQELRHKKMVFKDRLIQEFGRVTHLIKSEVKPFIHPAKCITMSEKYNLHHQHQNAELEQ